jgi:hypothetical protein
MELSFLSRIFEFSIAFLWNWKALIAGAFFMSTLLPNLLSEPNRERLDRTFPQEWRRKILVILAFLFLFISAFQAYDDVNTRLKQALRLPRDGNALYQNGVAVAVVISPIVDATAQTIVFPAATASVELDMAKTLEFRDWKLLCVGQSSGFAQYGAIRQINYPNLRCKIIGTI